MSGLPESSYTICVPEVHTTRSCPAIHVSRRTGKVRLRVGLGEKESERLAERDSELEVLSPSESLSESLLALSEM